MSAVEDIPLVTFADYLATEQTSDRRREFVAGRVYVMAGGTERHHVTAEAVHQRLRAGALSSGCRPFLLDRLVRLGDDAYYPDVVVTCGPRADRLFESDLDVVVEVLSPSTEDVDRREKSIAYASAPSFRQYLVVDPRRRRIEVATRGAVGLVWHAYGAGSVVSTPFGDLDVDDLYDEVDARSKD